MSSWGHAWSGVESIEAAGTGTGPRLDGYGTGVSPALIVTGEL